VSHESNTRFGSIQPNKPKPPFAAHNDGWVTHRGAGKPLDILEMFEVCHLPQVWIIETAPGV
jgi:hypothetical protein